MQEHGPQAGPGWLDETQGHIWITFMQVQLRLSYEMNRQLLSDGDLQLGDYHGAAPRHVALVRWLFFDGLPAELQAGFQAALDVIYRTLIASGTLPAPGQPRGRRRAPGLPRSARRRRMPGYRARDGVDGDQARGVDEQATDG